MTQQHRTHVLFPGVPCGAKRDNDTEDKEAENGKA